MTPVLGFAMLILDDTSSLIFPTIVLSNSIVLPPPSGLVGSVTSLTRVSSNPAVASASMVATFEFFGNRDEASLHGRSPQRAP
eukprot:CAMPEP_0115843860 /NCGR_PEP_ID=MMETSP0287-20121206/8533_1 /TAXON_ID=412157 /ORGANISM="Chrysochromulina rotalis, Strain UIO044" /LENGTH=82 /DNA_ID=CAMNT_0003297573 /DNA_START=247 /DNA_END=495 /DNA_ORIENTATION=+